MSEVLIKMEMPKDCDMCIYSAWSNYFQIYVCDAARESEPVLFGGKQVNIIDIVRSGRADNCPLIEIPPHGRLIDADAMDTSILQAGFSYAITRRKLRYTPGEVRQKIANAPTIIPAEEDE